jgi:hypothetical protein
MAEKEKDVSAEKKAKFDPDKRFNYIGFEVHTGKIKDFFRDEDEKQSWVKRVLEKRKRGAAGRDHSTFDIPRVAVFEKIVLTVTSLLLVSTLFMPWFSGYTEYEVRESAAAAPAAPAPVDSLAGTAGIIASQRADSMTLATTTESGQPASTGQGGVTTEGRDEHGFASITGVKKSIEIRKERHAMSALGALASLGGLGGKIFSSGIVLIITGILTIAYILICVLSAAYTIYMLYGTGGDADTKALRLKRGLRLNWIPIGIWVFCLIISFGGASYSFDTTGMITQVDGSYGISVFLGLLSYGFYISLACLIMNAVKAVEI